MFPTPSAAVKRPQPKSAACEAKRNPIPPPSPGQSPFKRGIHDLGVLDKVVLLEKSHGLAEDGKTVAPRMENARSCAIQLTDFVYCQQRNLRARELTLPARSLKIRAMPMRRVALWLLPRCSAAALDVAAEGCGQVVEDLLLSCCQICCFLGIVLQIVEFQPTERAVLQ